MNQLPTLPYSFAKRHQVLLAPPISADDTEGARLWITADSPLSAIGEVKRMMGSSAASDLALEELTADEFQQKLSAHFAGDTGSASQQVADGIEDHPDLLELADQVPESEDLMDQEGDAPIVRLINALLSEAIRLQASDIHIETFERRLAVRFRVDGELREVISPKRALAPLLVSRIKVLARLDIAEKRVPQDGRISLKLAGREIDVRVSTLPSSFGERVVMRLLDKQNGRLSLNKLGLKPVDLTGLQSLIHRPHGILLVTGPTGSGKTTTLYASLSELNDGKRNIMTAEDPIEYQIDGISQTQVNPKVEMTFARSLRAMLRQDPDVVMVGEIRDLETAQIAVQASLTGHLVISTLHTNTAIGAITRLRDMGIEPFLLSGSLIGMVAQRLVRVLCVHCKTESPTDAAQKLLFEREGIKAPAMQPVAVGCAECNQLGYRGRTAIYEVIQINDTLARHIHSSSAEHTLEQLAREQTNSIRFDGLSKVIAGVTTIEEVLRTTTEAVESLEEVTF